MLKNTPTFYKDGKRRIKCPWCKKFVGKKKGNVLTTKLDHKTYRAYNCCHCRKEFIVYPPQKGLNDKGEKIIKWGPDLMHTTADLTDDEFEDTINLDIYK
jgi:hypothetical protein